MERASQVSIAYRIMQLVIGMTCMVAIANLQYGWTLFVEPINQKFNWGRPAIQVAFTVFILMETWLVPVEGWLIDKFGLRKLFLLAGVLVASGWVINGYATSLPMLYMGAVVAGIGGGIVYGGSVGNALKWFPDHRGLAAGLTAAGYGMGSALTVVPIANMIRDRGYEFAFITFGIAQGLIIIVLALIFRAPQEGEVPQARASNVQQTAHDSTPSQMVRTPIFWILYLMFTMMATGGLMATAQLASMATDYKIADIPVSLLGLTLAALPFAVAIDRVLNGLTRPFFGWVSDRLGRENTMLIAFSLEGLGKILLLMYAGNPVAFVIFSGLVFFAWGEIYSLFPSICADIYGRRYATANYGLLYTAKGTASLLALAGAWLVAVTGSWVTAFVIAAAFDIAAALLAILVLKPMRMRALSACTA
ncbi:MAG: oxalate/formate MFS antiporter [Acidobacteria bacterium]|nr:oxalate/formate MFS antiporter [Acidobacteriota bacterium]